VLKAHLSGIPGKGFSALGSLANEGGCPRSPAPLGEWVALLAMKYRRAPLPVPRGLERALMCQGLADDPAELGDLARRYLFFGDAWILLAESRNRPTPVLNSLELVKQLDAEKQTQSEIGVPCQCP
jgi:hypothetical protein